jgi:hypothetical protein
MALEERVSRLEGAYEQVDRRLDDVTQSVQSLRNDMNVARAETNSRFNTVYIMIGGLWATVIAGFIALFLKL